MSDTTLFHSLAFRDVDAAIEFLSAVGFTEAGVYRDDSGRVVHAQYDWRGGSGGIMFGGTRDADDPLATPAGQAQCYCVVAEDADVDRVHASALAAGATSVREPEDQDYGGRGCTVTDPEGNLWSFGSYPGE